MSASLRMYLSKDELAQDRRRSAARARAEQPDGQRVELGNGFRPLTDCGEPPGEHGDVEPQMTGPRVDRFFFFREEVDQQRRHHATVERVGDVAVSRAEAAA